MNRDEQIGRMILEALAGIHGDIARDLAQAWCNLAEKKQDIQSRLEELNQKVEGLEKNAALMLDALKDALCSLEISRQSDYVTSKVRKAIDTAMQANKGE